MDGYEKSVRPVFNSSTVVMVKFGLHLNQIIGLVGLCLYIYRMLHGVPFLISS